ncbi:MAG: VCBS repeat-containing protein [Candidatus Hydrogenedentes bacterium]|nr:VCBS repeat-containing protein [Candidatus Hydrogenedentota bacterium]
MRRLQVTALGLLFSALCPCIPSESETWIEDSFEDFADGRLDAAGQNIYVSREGAIRTIHRFDLNQDGYIDVLFNSTHDLVGILPSTWATVNRRREVAHGPLAVEGSNSVVAGDLNRDGFNDLVFGPNRNGIQSPRRFLTMIWGGRDGWPASRSNSVLPVYDAVAVAIVDLNVDGWPDIAALNGEAWMPGQPPGRIVRVYWGSEHSFQLQHYRDFGVSGAMDLAGADLDGDNAGDLAVLTSEQTVQVFWASGESRPATIMLPGSGAQCIAAGGCNGDALTDVVVGTDRAALYLIAGNAKRDLGAVEIPALDASHIEIGHLDMDGLSDLVLTQVAIGRAAGGEATGAEEGKVGHVKILWGSDAGFDVSGALDLSVQHATATAIGDIDGDRNNDLALAVYQGSEQFAAESVILLGNGRRKFRRAPAGVPTNGATDAAIVPLQQKSRPRAVFCNSAGGTVNEKVNLDLYWGGPNGFGTANRTQIPFVSGYESSAADLNCDGFVDLVALCSGHLGASAAASLPELGANIYWGREGGFDFSQRPTVLREFNLYSSNIADLNKDGYLDLVLGAFDPPQPGQADLLVIYYGSVQGYTAAGRVAISSAGRSSICGIADYNRDEWLDIAVTCYNQHCVRIFWGSPAGFDEKRQQQLQMSAPIELETADLNADGHLDLIVGSYEDSGTHYHDTGTFIFWGSAGGYQEWNAQWLPGFTPLGYTVADFDSDGHLDLFAPCYHGEVTRESLPSYLYWGSASGFETRDRTILMGDSNADALAADFDRDGKLDIALACHTRDGNHAAESKVFYNDGARFAHPRVITLPTTGPHWMWGEDMGHIYHRCWEQRYESSLFTWEGSRACGTLTYAASIPQGTRLDFAVRTARKRDLIPEEPWQAASNGQFTVRPRDRVLQYRATFISDNGDRFPVLDRVALGLNGRE